MAVNDSEQGSLAKALNTAGVGISGNQQKQQPQQQTQQTGFSFRNLGGMSRMAMGRTPASEALSKLMKALTTVYEEAADKSFEITPIPIDYNSTVSLNISALVICLRDKSALDIGVAYHTLIIEASIDPVAPKYELVNSVNVEIIRVAGDAYDVTMNEFIVDAVRKQFPQSTLLPVGHCVVPRTFNVADPMAVYNLAANALAACSQELQVNDKAFVDLNLSQASKDSNLTVRTTFGNPQITNAVGQPVRSDIQIEFAAAPTTNQNNQAVERTSVISRVSGFMDLVWDPVQAPTNFYYAPQQQSFQRYVARFVMTMMESHDLLTIPAQLLGLLPALNLRENNAWIQAFKQHNYSQDIDIHDIGAVGIEANFEGNPNGIGKRIDTRSDSFQNEHLYKLVASTIRQGMLLSLDIPESGPESWYNEVFVAAADGNQVARNMIIAAANQLTNGHFNKYFNNNDAICIHEENRIHLGTYVDANGVIKDLRDVDYLAVLNLVGEKDPQIVRDWSDSFIKTGYPLPMRLSGRKRTITSLFNEVKITGFARRVTFENNFMDALARAAIDAGLNIRSTTAYTDIGSYERATASGFTSGALMSGDQTGLFRATGYNAGAAMGYRPAVGFRF